MPEDRRRTVKVMCSIPNGVELRTFAPGYDDGTGTGNRMQQRVTGTVLLKGPSSLDAGVNAPSGVPVETEVDAEFWDTWLNQNEKNTLLTTGAVAGPDQKERDGG